MLLTVDGRRSVGAGTLMAPWEGKDMYESPGVRSSRRPACLYYTIPTIQLIYIWYIIMSRVT